MWEDVEVHDVEFRVIRLNVVINSRNNHDMVRYRSRLNIPYLVEPSYQRQHIE